MARESRRGRGMSIKPRKTAAKHRRRTTTAVRHRESAALRQARVDLAAAFRWAVRFGLHEGVCNHFSLAVPDANDRYLINPQGLHWCEIRASDLLVIDGNGTVVAGDRPVEATAFYIHSRIHRARPSARCVLHTHMPYATALTIVEGGRLEPCSQNALRFYGQVAYDDESVEGGGYRGLALDNAEGDRMARILGEKRILFLANHGVVVVGPDVASAFDDLYYVERAAEAQILAQSTGGRLRMVGDNLARATQSQIAADQPVYARHHFDALKRILDREAPEYRR